MAKIIQPLIFALQFLTRMPVGKTLQPDACLARKALMTFPLVGWLIGGVLYAAWRLTGFAPGINALSVAVIIVAVETALTGAFHLDGLADSFDAFFSSGKTREEKLAIMKDSRIGVMGSVVVTLALLLKTTLLAGLFEHHAAGALLAYPVAGRWSQVAGYVFSPYVREGGIGSLFSQSADKKSLAAATLFSAPCFFVSGFFLSLPLLVLSLFLYRGYVHRQIGGITGDVLGSMTVLAELVVLAAITLWPH